MKYIDSLDGWRRKGIKYHFSSLKLKRQTQKLVKGWLGDVDFMISWIKSNENQIEIWKDDDDSLYDSHIQFYKNLNEFIYTNCRLLLFECDIRVAATHMFLSCDDWEYRLFCRRIFTLFHEMQKGFSNIAGMEAHKSLIPYFGAEAMMSYVASKKKLDEFLEKNDGLFKRVRNKCEAHKDSNVCEQIRMIEGIGVNESWILIEEGLGYLLDLSVELRNVLRLFASKHQDLYKNR